MKVRYILTAVITAISSILVSAQHIPVTPVSPEAAALNKMVSYPVNLNTGLPSISIPLYQIKTGNLTLPIDLTYHSGGFKINERSTSVGLGWSLTSDIQITRSINGLDDFTPGIGYIANTKMKAYNSSSGGYPFNSGIPFPQRNIYDIAAGEVDGAPDQFTYKLLGKSGTFYFQKNSAGTGGYMVPVPFENIKIEFNNGQFTITDTDGTIYTFGTSGGTDLSNMASDAKELSGSLNSVMGTCLDCRLTTWKCKKIENANKTHYLEFTYQKKSDIRFSSRPESVEYFNNESPCNLNTYIKASQVSGISSYEGLVGNYPFFSLSSPKYIEHFSDKPSLFHFPYLDVNDQMVDNSLPFSLTVNTISTAVASLVLSKIEYREGSVVFSGTNQLNYIRVQDPSNVEVKTFHFFQSYKSPIYVNEAKSANGQDFLGTMYLDSVQVRNGSNVYERYGLMYKEKFCFGNHLKGKDAWGYSNDFTAERYASISSNSVPHQSITQRFYRDNMGGCTNFINNFVFNIGNPSKTELPSRDPAQRGILKRIIYPTGGYVDFDFEANKYEVMVDTLKAVRMGGGLRIRSINYFDGKSALPVSQKYYRYGELENGIGLTINKPDISIISGIDYDAYSFSQNTAYITGPPDANLGNDFDPIPINCAGRSCMNVRAIEKKTTYMPASALEYNYSTGAPIYYTHVTEYQQDMGNSTGKTVHIFYKPDHFAFPNFLSNKIPGTNIEVIRNDELMGKQQYLKEYKFENGKYSLVHSKEFIYNKYTKTDQVRVVYGVFNVIYQIIGGNFMGNNIDLYNSSQSFNSNPYSLDDYIYGEYSLEVGQLLLKDEIEQWHDGAEIATRQTKYYYDNPTYLQVSRIEVNDSRSDNITKYYKYCYDYPGISIYDQMKTKNMISPIIEETVENTTLLTEISRTRTDYVNFTVGFGIIAPSEVKKSFGGNALTTEYSFDLYDAQGNVLQTTEKGHRVKSYIYGYNYNYPVAEVEGVNYSTATLGMNMANIQSYSETELKNLFNSLRGSISGFVKSFVYKPLIGISTETDIKGLLTSYVYDPIGRLEIIKDYQDRIIKKIDYLMTGKTTMWPSTSYYVNVPIMESFNQTCLDMSVRHYNYIYPGGRRWTTTSQRQADRDAENDLVLEAYNGIINCANSIPLSTVSIGTISNPANPWPEDLSLDLFKDGNLEVSIRTPAPGLTNKVMSFPAGTYTIVWRQNENYNRSTISADIEVSGVVYLPLKSGGIFTFEPGVTYPLLINNLLINP